MQREQEQGHFFGDAKPSMRPHSLLKPTTKDFSPKPFLGVAFAFGFNTFADKTLFRESVHLDFGMLGKDWELAGVFGIEPERQRWGNSGSTADCKNRLRRKQTAARA